MCKLRVGNGPTSWTNQSCAALKAGPITEIGRPASFSAQFNALHRNAITCDLRANTPFLIRRTIDAPGTAAVTADRSSNGAKHNVSHSVTTIRQRTARNATQKTLLWPAGSFCIVTYGVMPLLPHSGLRRRLRLGHGSQPSLAYIAERSKKATHSIEAQIMPKLPIPVLSDEEIKEAATFVVKRFRKFRQSEKADSNATPTESQFLAPFVFIPASSKAPGLPVPPQSGQPGTPLRATSSASSSYPCTAH